MKADFDDIKKRIEQIPKWFDENGTPRYDKFHPNLSPNIYADEVILLKIACQSCGGRILVEMNWSRHSFIMADKERKSFSELIKEWKEVLKKKPKGHIFSPIHYGDPPRHEPFGGSNDPGICGCVGDSMNCYDLRIIEFWQKCWDKQSKNFGDWVRKKKYEIELEKEVE